MQEQSKGNVAGASAKTPACYNTGPRLPISNGYIVTAIYKATTVDYLRAIVDVIGQSKVKSFGKMGPNFAFWVDDEESVATMEITSEISIKNQTAMIWPYVNPIRRIKLMGVPPFLPNGLIEEKFKQYGTLNGDIKIETIFGLPEEFGTIESFSRTLHLSCDRKTVVPDKVKLPFNGKEYEIMVQVGRRKCFKCGSILHISANCTGKKGKPNDKDHMKDQESKDDKEEKKNNTDPKTDSKADEESSIVSSSEYETETGTDQSSHKKPVTMKASSYLAFRARKRKKMSSPPKVVDKAEATGDLKSGRKPYPLRKDPNENFDWHYNEWKTHPFHDQALPNEKLLQFLKETRLYVEKEITNHEDLAAKFEAEPKQLAGQLFELKQIIRASHKTTRGLLEKLALAYDPAVATII